MPLRWYGRRGGTAEIPLGNLCTTCSIVLALAALMWYPTGQLMGQVPAADVPTQPADEAPKPADADVDKDESASDERPARPLTDAEVRVQVAELSNKAWPARQAAEERLIAAGPKVLAQLDPHLGRASDSEVLDRLERVYRRHVPSSEYQGESLRSGFLGVGISVVSGDEEPSLPPRRCGVKIARIITDSGADKGGLQVDDLILSVDGEEFIGDATNQHFIDRVQRVGEGGSVRLLLVRGGERKELTVKLLPRPEEVPVPPEERAVDPRVLDYRWQCYWKAHREAMRTKYDPPAKPGDKLRAVGERTSPGAEKVDQTPEALKEIP